MTYVRILNSLTGQFAQNKQKTCLYYRTLFAAEQWIQRNKGSWEILL
jgi:hypothetical protein